MILSLASSAVFVAAAAVLTGRTTLAQAGVVVGFALLLLSRILSRCRSAGPAPGLEPDEAAVVRAVRGRDGEPAAGTRLREGQPGLGLVDAVRLVRTL